MNDREILLRAIASDPEDDVVRLAFADWLQENGEEPFAEYIRVQIELEPFRDLYEVPRAKMLHDREAELEKDHHKQALRTFRRITHPSRWPKDWQAEWELSFQTSHGYQRPSETIGIGEKLRHAAGWLGIRPFIRRGFLDEIACCTDVFLKFGGYLLDAYPTIRHVTLYCLNGWGDYLAHCPHLQRVRSLELACWYSESDARDLTASRHLDALEELTIWNGGRTTQRAIDPERLCRQFASVRRWPKLRKVRVVGCHPRGEDDWSPLVEVIDKTAGRKLGVGQPAFAPRFPLAEKVETRCTCYCGRLPDGQLAFVYGDPCGVDHALPVQLFASDGTPTSATSIPHDPHGWQFDSDAKLRGRGEHYVRKTLRLLPSFIRVKEFALEEADVILTARGRSNPGLGFPDVLNGTDRSYYRRNGVGGSLDEVSRKGQFVLSDSGKPCYGDNTGLLVPDDF